MKDFKLDNEPKITAGFSVPDGYFDTFSGKVLAQLPKQEPKVVSIFSSGKTWYYAAAAVLIMTLSIPAYNNYKLNKEEAYTATLENYITYHTTEDEIVDLLNQEDIDKMKLDLNINDQEIEDALKSNSNLEEYITD